LTGRELRVLRRLRREAKTASPFVFVSERGSPFTTSGFAKMLTRAGEVAGLEMPVHPHMLRHACGFVLANRGTDTRTIQAYLGHKNIQHTVRYTALSSNRFNGLWGTRPDCGQFHLQCRSRSLHGGKLSNFAGRRGIPQHCHARDARREFFQNLQGFRTELRLLSAE
jgi:hypothetical protein